MRYRFRLGILACFLIASELSARAGVSKEKYKTMAVVICDEVDLDSHTFVDATARTTEIFQKAGIQIVWFQGCRLMPVLPSYFVVVIAHQPPPEWVSSDAMGFAAVRTGDQRRAYVFLDRINEFLDLVERTDLRPPNVGLALAHAIAHELGHLLLPGEAHTSRGIMSTRWNSRQWQDAMTGSFWFLPDQVKAMQKELGTLHSQTDSRVVGPGPN